MGVPKFFRYTSERYPCLNELVKQYQIPDFDNMYLDMNGIIHNCSHPDDSDPHFRITEEKIFQDVFHYISILFQIIKPKKLFFMAIDGVAPRAKMNQQRGRRFRSAREAEDLEEKAKAKGEVLPSEKRFDSNCITPGTVFMARLHEQLRYFVKHKISTDPLWSKVKVVLSGHETPGEGEHKIMDYIRWQRSQPEYDPNTRHCLYGLDADLIMLGLCTHEPHFALLREEVKFGKTTQRATSPEETNFYLLHLSLMREYLEQEFISIKDKLPFPFDIEKIVDDWVLMGFLVGNDFIPNLPNLHINKDALPVLYKTYMDVLPTLDGYINEAGDLNLARFEIFMHELAKIDIEAFQDNYVDLKYFEEKTGRRPNMLERKEYKPNDDETFNVNIEHIKSNEFEDELQTLINSTNDALDLKDDIDNEEFEYDESSDDESNFEKEFILHKKDYYMNKLDYTKVTSEVLAGQAEGYVRAIQWNLYYYYKGCPSWCWYYPHHYSPYISDIKGFKDLKIEFELGEPFKPFEQLLAVLPSASKHLLPTPFHDLMTDEDSPIVHYYPVIFETDLNGKRNDWEAVVLIPFIDETNLLSAMAPCYQRLTEEEKKRNTHGPMLVYNWSPDSQGTAEAPEYFPTIVDCHAIEQEVLRQELQVPESQLKRGLLPNAKKDLLFPGFPTMRHLKYSTSLIKGKVKVFDQPSRSDNMIIKLITEEEEEPLKAIAKEFLGKIIWVGWPHLTEAKVISVSDEKMRLHLVDKPGNVANGQIEYNVEMNHGNLHKRWISERSTIIEHNMNRLGIELGDVTTILHAVNLKGFKYVVQDGATMALEEEWCSVPCGYARQAVVSRAAAPPHAPHPPRAARYCSPRDAYPPGDRVFLLARGDHYGAVATVVDSDGFRSGRIKVSVSESKEPATGGRAGAAAPYYTANHAAALCGISYQLLSRITGTVLVADGQRNHLPTENMSKLNIGLNLKFSKKNQEVSGYTRRCRVSGAWLYSARCAALVREYARRFPALLDRLAAAPRHDVYFESDLWPQEMGENKAKEVVQWLKSQPFNSAQRRECGSEALEPEEMKALAQSIDSQLTTLTGTEKTINLQVEWSLLYKPELCEGNIGADPKADFKMLDRVVCVARNITVPYGAKGTITAIFQPSNSNTVRLSDKLNAEPSYQVLFDKPFPGALKEDLFEEPRFYRMLPINMLNISYGRKLRDLPENAPAPANFDPYARTPASADANVRAPASASAHARTPAGASAHIRTPPGASAHIRTPPGAGVSVHTPTDAHGALRRDDFASAFVNYSPPAASQTPFANGKLASPSASIQTQDATHLLKSLLKISEGEPVTKADENSAESNNWRLKEDIMNPPPPTQKMQPQNWRRDTVVPPFNQLPPNPQFKNQQPPISYPPVPDPTAFSQVQSGYVPQHNPPDARYHGNNTRSVRGYIDQPGRYNDQRGHYTDQRGHYSDQRVHYSDQRGHYSDQRGHFSDQRGNYQDTRFQIFPSTLPNVSGNITLPPRWKEDQKQSGNPTETYQSNVENIINPFVPLQVHASQRKVQNPNAPMTQSEIDRTAPPALAPPTDQQNAPPKPVKKRKHRIAANLPFQLD